VQTKHPGAYKGFVIYAVSSPTTTQADGPPFFGRYSFAKIRPNDSLEKMEHVECHGVFGTAHAAHEAAYLAARKHVDSLT
jgi:hypothetical protein